MLNIETLIKSALNMRDAKPDTVYLPKHLFDTYQKIHKNNIGDKSKMYYAGYAINVEQTDSENIEYSKDGVLVQ